MDYEEKIKQLAIILDKIIEAFKIANDSEYIEIFKRYRGYCEYAENEEDTKKLARVIMRSYRGGMGSFNDLVLYTNGKCLPEPAEEFDRLKNKLFNVCVDTITKPRESVKSVEY